MRGKTSATRAMSSVLTVSVSDRGRQERDELPATTRVEPGRGLVEHEHGRVHGQDRRQ